MRLLSFMPVFTSKINAMFYVPPLRANRRTPDKYQLARKSRGFCCLYVAVCFQCMSLSQMSFYGFQTLVCVGHGTAEGFLHNKGHTETNYGAVKGFHT